MTKNAPSSASEELLSVPGEKLGIVGSAPSFVSASGEPFLWSEKPMLVKKIVRNGTPVALVVHETRSGKFSDSWVRWSANGPEVITAPNGEEFLIAADEPLVVAVGANVEGADFEEMDEEDFEEMDEGGGDSPKTGATLRGIALIPSKGEKFLTLNLESPLICDKNDVFSTTQQDGDFRLVRMVANSERYLAVRVGNGWKIAYGPGNARVSVMPGFPFSSGWGFVKHDQLDYACQYRNGKFEEVSTLEFWKGLRMENIFPERSPSYRSEFIHSGMVGRERVRFCFDTSRPGKILYAEMNGSLVFHNSDGIILHPKNLAGWKIRSDVAIHDLKGFSGVTLFLLEGRSGGGSAYTDGKGMYNFQGSERKIETYENPQSAYCGYPLSASSFQWGGRGYGAYFSGKVGKDFVSVVTREQELLILLSGKKERVVSLNGRNEVLTAHARSLAKDGIAVVGFHPNAGVIVLRPRTDDSTSYYRYYGIGKDGSLTYLGSKENVEICNSETVATFRNGHRSDRYGILLGSENESRAFIVGKNTFFPVMNDEGEPVLLKLTTEEYRNLRGEPYADIPAEWIVDGKISEKADLASLLQVFPGTDLLFSPGQWAFPPHAGRVFQFVNTEWNAVSVKKVTELPTVEIGGAAYYLCSNESKTDACLWDPRRNLWVEIPSLTHYQASKYWCETFPDGTSGIVKTNSGTYVYPKIPGLPEDLRMTIVPQENGTPNYGFRWYNETENKTSLIIGEYGIPLISQEAPFRKSDGTLVFQTESGIQALNPATRENVPFPTYPGLTAFFREVDSNVRYRSPIGEVEYEDDGVTPQRMSFEGETGYVVERNTYSDWIPGSEPQYLPVFNCYLPSKQITAPFVFRDGSYVPVFDIASIWKGWSVRLSPGSVVVTPKDSQESWIIGLETVAKVAGEGENTVIIHDIVFESKDGYAIAYGQNISKILQNSYRNGAGGKSSAYFLYKAGTDTLCREFKQGFSMEGEDLVIAGIRYDRTNDAELIAAWLKNVAFPQISKPSTAASVVAEKKGAVGSALEGSDRMEDVG